MSSECIKGATLLSKEEAKNLLTREERTCKGTREAINNGLWVSQNGNSIYWLRSAGGHRYSVCYVSYDGDVYYSYGVDGAGVGIRPALILNLKSSNLMIGDSFEFGDYTFKIISNDLALCDAIVDTCPFNKSEEDGSDYETSYIKKKVDEWFNKTFEGEKKYSEEQQAYKDNNTPTDKDIWDVWSGW